MFKAREKIKMNDRIGQTSKREKKSKHIFCPLVSFSHDSEGSDSEHSRLEGRIDALKKANLELILTKCKLKHEVEKISNENKDNHKRMLKLKKKVKHGEQKAKIQRASSNELIVKNKELSLRKKKLQQKLQTLKSQLDNTVLMGVTLPKEAPQDPAKLQGLQGDLRKLAGKLRSLLIQSYEAQMTCMICCVKAWDSTIIPCGHCFCNNCAQTLNNYCSCGQRIIRLQKIY